MCAHLEGAACVVLTSLNVVQGQSSGKKRRRRKHLPERIDVEVTEKEQKEQFFRVMHVAELKYIYSKLGYLYPLTARSRAANF